MTSFQVSLVAFSSGAAINAEKLLKEVSECKVSAERLSIDPQVMIINKRDIAAEQELVNNYTKALQGL